MKYIFHISDIHISDDRITNLTNSFNQLVKDIINKPDSILVIVGDIFENKTYITTNEICIFQWMMHTLNKNNIQTIIIPGNHDFNINNTNITSDIFKHTTIEILISEYANIKCLTYSQIYTPQNTKIDFYVLSIIDNKVPEFRPSPNIKIALLHDAVNGALYDNDSVIEGEKFGVADFEKYDYTLLGDIHKPQFLKPNIAYCGSFVQKNKGEGLDHGYILWDLAKKCGAHKFIPMKEIFIKISANKDIYTLPDLLPDQICKYVSLYHTNCNPESVETIKTKMIAKYGFINKIINNNIYSTSITKTHALENLSDIGTIDHEQSIKDLLKGETPESIQAIINHHNKSIQDRKEVNFVKYRINYMAWDNLLCYGKGNCIDFRDFSKSIVILNGKNKYGKSSIIDILIRVLFNECDRGYKQDMVNKNKNSGNVKLSLSIGSDEYVIEQMMDKSGKHPSHSLYKNGVSITKQSINETYKYLRETIGIGDYKDFINITTALQHRKFLVDLKQDDLVALLSKLLNIDVLYTLEKTTRKELIGENKLNSVYASDIENLKKLIDPDAEIYETWLTSQTATNNAIDSNEQLIDKYNISLQQLNRRYNVIDIPDNLSDQMAIQQKYLKDFVLMDKDKTDFDEKKIKLQVLKSKQHEYTFDNEIHQSQNLTEAECIHIIKTLTSNTVKPTTMLSSEIMSKKDDTKKLSLKVVNDFSNIPRKILQNISSADLEIISQKLSQHTSKKTLGELEKTLEKFLKENIPKDLEKLYSQRKPAVLYNAAFDQILAKVDEPDLSRISQLEKLVSSNKPSLKLPDIPLIDDKELLRLKSIAQKQLPDYKTIEKSVKSMKLVITNYQDKYGKLNFSNDCLCCSGNKGILKAMYDIDSELIKLTNLENILKEKDKTILEQNLAIKSINDIDLYNKTKVANEEIAINNSRFAELTQLQNLKTAFDLQKTHEQYLFNAEIDALINDAKKFNAEIDDAKALMADIKIHKNQIYNAEIDVLFNAAKKFNAEIDDAKALVENIENQERYILLQAARFTHSQYINQKISSLESLVNAENIYWQKFDINSAYQKNIALKKIYGENLEIKKQIDKLVENISAAKSENISLVSQRILLANNISTHDSNKILLKSLVEKNKTSSDHIAFLQRYKKCVSKTGIANNIITKVCEVLNLRCNSILKDIADFSLDISYVKNELKIYTIESDIKIPAAMASGYQKFVLDMIMRVVLTSSVFSSTIMTIANPNILIIDEGFGCLDKQNFIEVAKVLTKLKDNFHAMIIITHLDELKAYATHSLNINKVRQDSILFNAEFGAGLRAGSEGVFRLESERNVRQDVLDKTRALENERRAAVKAEKDAGLAGKIAEKQAVIDAKAADKARRVAEKQAVIDAKVADKARRAAEKQAGVDAKAATSLIMADINQIKQHIITAIVMEDDMPKFTCLACNKSYLHSDRKVAAHLNAASFKVKHNKYIYNRLLNPIAESD